MASGDLSDQADLSAEASEPPIEGRGAARRPAIAGPRDPANTGDQRSLGPAVVQLHWRPEDPAVFAEQIRAEAARVDKSKSGHEVRAGRWAVVDTWAKLIVALGAALSTVAILANNEVFSIFFAVSTAIVSALNAALSPPDVSSAHDRAARDYGRPLRHLGEMFYALDSRKKVVYEPQEVASEGGTYDAGQWVDHYTVESDLLDELWKDFSRTKNEIDEIEQRAPALNRLRRYHGRFADNQDPETYWEFRRFKRALKYQTKAAQFRKKAWEASRHRVET